MVRFYGTFMQKQAFKNHYVEFVVLDSAAGIPNPASPESIAREAMFAHFGDKFMTVYSEKEFDGQIERFNLRSLCKIQCKDFGSSTEYRIL